jgi:DNA-binding FrmR family transcriptional regulator
MANDAGIGEWLHPRTGLVEYPGTLYFSEPALSHTARQKTKLLARVRRIRGQVEAVERALEAEAGCTDILHLLAASRGAMNGLMLEVIDDHVREHVAAGELSQAARTEGADELLDVIRSYLK